jgi:site-specific DNA-methyltransferase (adenine-specific)
MKPYYESEYGKLYLGDCLEIVPSLQEKVELVLTDPPYGVTQCKWDAVIPFDKMWEGIQKISVEGVVCALTSAQPFSSLLVASNTTRFCYEWVWIKSKITGFLNAKKMPVRKHEQILIFCESKATPVYNPQGLVRHGKIMRQGGNSDNYGERNKKEYFQEFTNYPRDVLEIPSEGKTQHPTQKPVALMEYLIRTYTNFGDTVLDFTIGSGTTAVAAINTGRKFIGIEKEEKYCEIAKQRIVEAEEKMKEFEV